MNRTRTLSRTPIPLGLVVAIAALTTTPHLALGGHGGGRMVVSGAPYRSATPPMLVPSNEPYYAPPTAPAPKTYAAPTQSYQSYYRPPAASPTYTYPTQAAAPTYQPQPTGYYAPQPTGYYVQQPAGYSMPRGMTVSPRQGTIQPGFRPARMFSPMRIFRNR